MADRYFRKPTSTQMEPSVPARIYKFLNKKDNHADEPPDGGLTAWLQVVGCFFIFMNNFGLASAFGVYQAYYQRFMFPDYSASSISWIGTIQASLTLIVGILSGPLFDKGFFFFTVTVASFGLVFSFMMLSISTQFWQVVLCQGLLAGICSGLLYIPSVSQIPLYFTSKRGLALGIVLSGAPFGGIVYPLIFKRILESVGFGWATRAIGFVALATLATALVLVKPLHLPNRPEKLRDPTIFKNTYYVALIVGGFLVFCGMMIPYFDCATFWYSKFDQDLDHAFHTLLIINAGNFLGRIVLAAITDHYDLGEHLLNACTIGLAILGFGWVGIHSRAAYYAFLVLWGFFSGGITTLPVRNLAFIVPRPELFATCLGVIYFFAGIGLLIGAPIANAIDKNSSFLGSQLWCGITAAIAIPFSIYSGIGTTRGRKQMRSQQFQTDPQKPGSNEV